MQRLPSSSEAVEATSPSWPIQFSVREPGVATTLIGTADPRELELNLQWVAEPLDEELLTLVQRMLAPIHNVTWTTGRPENN